MDVLLVLLLATCLLTPAHGTPLEWGKSSFQWE